MNKKKIYSGLLKLIGLIVFLYIILNIDFKLFIKEFSAINIPYLLIAFALMLGVIVAKSLRWRSILKSLNIKIDQFLSLRLFWLGTYVGIITPGKIGEIVKAYFLKARGHDPLKSIFSIIADRILDIIILLLIGFFVAIFYLTVLKNYIIILGSIPILLIVLFFLVFNEKGIFYRLIDKFLKNSLGKKFDNYNISLRGFWQEIKNIKLKYLVETLFYLILSWFLYFFSLYLIAQSLHIRISPILTVATTTAAAIVSMLPISIAGLGTRDATIIYIFSLISLSKESAVIFSFFILITELIAIAFGAFPYFKELSLIKNNKLTPPL